MLRWCRLNCTSPADFPDLPSSACQTPPGARRKNGFEPRGELPIPAAQESVFGQPRTGRPVQRRRAVRLADCYWTSGYLLSDDAREQLSKYELIGELGLYGELRLVRGVLPAAMAVMHTGRTLIVQTENLAEASLQAPWRLTASYPDLADVRGQESGRRALEVAAAGGHNSFLLVHPVRAIRCWRLGCRVCYQNLSLMQRPRWLTYIPQVMVDST